MEQLSRARINLMGLQEVRWYVEITEASPAICPGEGVCRYAHVLLARVKGHLQRLPRTEQSGFTPHRSTVDRITTLNMILQTRREYKDRPGWLISTFALLLTP